jgi:hypothetical protein
MAPAPKLEGKASAIISPEGDIQFRLNLGSSWLVSPSITWRSRADHQATVSQHLDKILDPSLPDFRVSMWIHAEGTSTQLLVEPPIWADRSHRSTCRTSEILLTKVCEDGAIKMKWDLEEEATAVEDEDGDGDGDDKDEDDDGNDRDDDQSLDHDDSDEEHPPAKKQKTSNEDMPIEILSSDEERDQIQQASITAEKGKGKEKYDKGYLQAGEIVCSLPTDPADYGTAKVIPHPTKEGIYMFARNADGKIESLPDSPQPNQASVSETRLKQTSHPPSKQPSTISCTGVSGTQLNQPSHPPSKQPSAISSTGSSAPTGKGKASLAKVNISPLRYGMQELMPSAAWPEGKVPDNQAGAALNDSSDASPVVSTGQRTIKPTAPAGCNEARIRYQGVESLCSRAIWWVGVRTRLVDYFACISTAHLHRSTLDAGDCSMHPIACSYASSSKHGLVRTRTCWNHCGITRVAFRNIGCPHTRGLGDGPVHIIARGIDIWSSTFGQGSSTRPTS